MRLKYKGFMILSVVLSLIMSFCLINIKVDKETINNDIQVSYAAGLFDGGNGAHNYL